MIQYGESGTSTEIFIPIDVPIWVDASTLAMKVALKANSAIVDDVCWL